MGLTVPDIAPRFSSPDTRSTGVGAASAERESIAQIAKNETMLVMKDILCLTGYKRRAE
jgi:hypothetical protein